MSVAQLIKKWKWKHSNKLEKGQQNINHFQETTLLTQITLIVVERNYIELKQVLDFTIFACYTQGHYITL